MHVSTKQVIIQINQQDICDELVESFEQILKDYNVDIISSTDQRKIIDTVLEEIAKNRVDEIIDKVSEF